MVLRDVVVFCVKEVNVCCKGPCLRYTHCFMAGHLLASILVGQRSLFDHLNPMHLYPGVSAQGIRALMVFMMYPALSRMGYGMTLKQAVVLVWAGLRGAVGLALALFVLLDGKIADYRFRVLTFFMMGCIAAATTLIQGPTTGPLLQVGVWKGLAGV